MPIPNLLALIFWSNEKETFAFFVTIKKKILFGTAIGFMTHFNSANFFRLGKHTQLPHSKRK